MPASISGVGGVTEFPRTKEPEKLTQPLLNPQQVCVASDRIVRCANNPYHQNEPSHAEMRNRLAEAAILFVPGAGAEGFVAKEFGETAIKSGAMRWLSSIAKETRSALSDPELVGAYLAKALVEKPVGIAAALAGASAVGIGGYVAGKLSALPAPGTPAPVPSPTASSK